MLSWLQHLFGFRAGDGNSSQYLFWSGFGGMLVVWALSLLLIWWRTSCKAEWWCPLIARHDFTDPETGLTHRLCWVHHPQARGKNLGRARIAEIQRKGHLYLGDRPGRG